MAMAQQTEIDTNFHSTLNSIMTKVGDNWSCTVCGKDSSIKPNLEKQVESMHTEGSEYAYVIKSSGTMIRFVMSNNLFLFTGPRIVFTTIQVEPALSKLINKENMIKHKTDQHKLSIS